MKRIKDSYGSAKVYQSTFGNTWKVELNLGGTLHYFNADTKEEAIEIANAQTNGGKVVIEDSRKIKDENTPDVLDGVLFVAFEDGTEDEMIAEVNKHKNESGEIDGVQYETYETDSQDGVAMIDLCAMTGDANGFVKALLNEWGVAENVIDLEFEASDEMKEAVSDSRKIKDEWEDNESFYEYFGIQPATDEKTLLQGMDEILKGYSDREMAALQAEHYLNISADIAKGWLAKKGISTLDEFKKWCAQRQSYLRKGKRQRDKEVDESFEKMRQEINLEKMLKQAYQAYDEYEKAHSVSDSRVNDMTKPAHLRGYAEKVRAKRRKKNDEQDDERETEKRDVADSRRIKDARPLKEQNIWISFKEYAQDILDKAENDEEWYVKTYPNFRWYGVYEDGVPMTAEVYSNGGDSWSFEVYLANELEEMMLNVMQMPPLDSYLRFGGEDYVDEGRTPNAISFEDFFDFYADNLW